MDGAQGGPGGRGKVSEGIRQGLGVLSALKEAIEETIQDARDRGDLSPERAKEALRTALAKAQEAAEEARERLDFVPRAEVERLRRELDDLRARLDHLERGAGGAPSQGPTAPAGG